VHFETRRSSKPTDFRLITLLNLDYKILIKILVNRLRPLLAEHLQKNQFCVVPGNTIQDALATVRDTIAMAEVKKTPICLVSLDFQDAFDRISHTYLTTILRSYGLSDWFVDRIRTMYEGEHLSVSINGYISGPWYKTGVPIEHDTFCNVHSTPLTNAGPKPFRRATTKD
jgi:hypothetical protein